MWFSRLLKKINMVTPLPFFKFSEVKTCLSQVVNKISQKTWNSLTVHQIVALSTETQTLAVFFFFRFWRLSIFLLRDVRWHSRYQVCTYAYNVPVGNKLYKDIDELAKHFSPNAKFVRNLSPWDADRVNITELKNQFENEFSYWFCLCWDSHYQLSYTNIDFHFEIS